MNQHTKMLQIDVHSYWHIGTGHGNGPSLDAVVAKSSGLPFWPGKSLKGVFRDAFYQASTIQHLPHTQQHLYDLFGYSVNNTMENPEQDGPQVRFQSHRGQLQFSSAYLERGEAYQSLKKALDDTNTDLKRFFFTELSQVALEEDGTAKEGALRSIEVAKPVRLYAEVSYQGDNPKDAFGLLEKSFPLIRIMGAHRIRGLGRITVSFTPENKDGER